VAGLAEARNFQPTRVLEKTWGISKQEFLRRRALSDEICDPLFPRLDKDRSAAGFKPHDECVQRVMAHGK